MPPRPKGRPPKRHVDKINRMLGRKKPTKKKMKNKKRTTENV